MLLQKIKDKSLFVLLLMFLATACSNNNVYFQYHSVNAEAWDKDSLYVFDVRIEDTQPIYNVYINVRNTPDYPNQNLWLFISETTPDNVTVRDTIEFYLADHRGKWLGTGAGGIKEMPVLYKKNYHFDQIGTYVFEIGHGMRAEDLKGITEIGVRVEEVTN